MSYVTEDIISLSQGEGRYRKSLIYNFDEVIQLYKVELPNLIRESLNEQAAKVETYNKNLAVAKELGIL